MSTLKLSLLGPPQILLDGTPVAFDSRKAIALLAYLAVTEDRHTRAELALLLWPESDSKRPRGALRYTLSVIQTAPGAGWLEIDHRHIRLRVDDGPGADQAEEECIISSDVASFRNFLASPKLPDGRAGVVAAIEFYQDDFLAGFSLRDSVNFEEWHFFQCEEFRQQLIGALAALVTEAGERRDTAAAVRYA